jgi:ATP-dependent helicase Lhr and Lhr-like helicase
MSVFQRFPERLQHAISSSLGFSSLRPVQEFAGEAILAGKNTVVLAPTAGGKTEASIFPVIAGLLENPPTAVGALYVAPIKALLNNQEVRLGNYTQMVGLDRFVWHGDSTTGEKSKFIRTPAELLMTTPESLEVMLMSPRVPAKRLFESLRWIVVDEVHAFSGTDRGAHLMSVIERLAFLSKHDIQRIGLSATVGNPMQIAKWLKGSSTRESVVVDPPRTPSQRQIKIFLQPDVNEFSREAARQTRGKKSLFFCQSRALSESVADKMRDESVDVYVHHGSVSKEERQAAEERFAQGTNACIVCTSTLELGIDVGGLDLTFQANAPSSVSSFLQRMGRTGRRKGVVPNMTFMCEDTVALVQSIALVLLAQDKWVENVGVESRCWPVLVHQLLALTYEHGGIGLERCWQLVSRVPDFSGVSRQEFDALLGPILKEEYLFESCGLISMGQKAEKVFGKKNFMELYAVFSSPVLYKVLTETEQELGSLEQNFVDRLVEEMSTFLLGGRAWMALRIDHRNRVVQVQPAPRGKMPSWGGFVPQFLGFELCQKMKQVLLDETQYPFVDPKGQEAVSEWRRDLGESLRGDEKGFRAEGASVRWYTFAGGRINHTLRYALAWKSGWKVVPDNFSLRIDGDGVSVAAVESLLALLKGRGFWDDEQNRRHLRSLVPQYRLSKFQQVLPDRWQTEMIGGYLLDFDGAARFVTAA